MLFVEGYIRLGTNTIIPNEIVYLCISYISNVSKIFICLSNNYRAKTSLNILDIDSKTISKLEPLKLSEIAFKPFSHSYIPNISKYISVKDTNNVGIDTSKSYDALLCIEEFSKRMMTHKVPVLYLFLPDNNHNDNIYYEKYVCAKGLRSNQIVFCGEKHGIIYGYNGYLYQSKLQNINFETMNWNFCKINQKQICNYSTNYLMNYLSTKQKLFAMESKKNLFPNVRFSIEDTGTQLKCGMFDFDQNKWTNLSTFEHYDRMQSAFTICDNLYNEDIIYCIGQKGQISQYSFAVNKWSTFVTGKENMFNKDIVCWMDNNYVICCSDGYYFGLIDIRDRNHRWQRMDGMIQLANQFDSRTIQHSLFNYGNKRNVFL